MGDTKNDCVTENMFENETKGNYSGREGRGGLHFVSIHVCSFTTK